MTRRSQLRRVRQAAVRAIREHYVGLGLEEIDEVPVLVPITGACENVSTLFALVNEPNVYLSQTGQLSLEVELQHIEGLYGVIRSFRADRVDARHLNEFCLIEEEFAWRSAGATDPSDAVDLLLRRAQAGVTALLRGALRESETIEALGGSPERLALAAAGDRWPAATYREALALLERTGRFGELPFGVDLRAEHEAALVELISAEHGRDPGPVFVTHYPEHIKFFNMKIDPADPAVVLSADLLLPAAGESVGAAVREDDHAALVQRLEESAMLRHLAAAGRHTIEDFRPYLDLIGSGNVAPHAGYGIGLERVLQYILDEADIRNVAGIHGLAGALVTHPAAAASPPL